MTSDPNAATDLNAAPGNASTHRSDADADDPSDADDTDEPSTETDGASGGAIDAEPLTIELPDGTESVSEAILSNRRMLLSPEESALASENEVVELIDWVEDLAAKIEGVETTQTETIEPDVDDLESVVEDQRELIETQREQIDELRGAVESLADILGTSADWESFED